MRIRTLLLGLTIPLIGACATEAADDGVGPGGDNRGGLGKADIVGSCESDVGDSLCGGEGEGNCFCDDSCVEYGDCCGDVEEACGIDPDEPDGEPCGGFVGATCGDDQYCAYDAGQHCGAADASATCEERPEVCIELFAPVCGCDGNTYSNSCFAAAAGTGVLSDGECESSGGQFCGGIGSIQCPDDQVCVNDPTDACDPALGGADCGGVCVSKPTDCAPVVCQLACDALATGEDGCEVCACAEPPVECQPLLCQVVCENGFATDEDGCDICFCAAPPVDCQPLLCQLVCENGFATDADGCDVCSCV